MAPAVAETRPRLLHDVGAVPDALARGFAAEHERCRSAGVGLGRLVATPLGFQQSARTAGSWQAWAALHGPLPILLSGFPAIAGGAFVTIAEPLLFGTAPQPESAALYRDAAVILRAAINLADSHRRPLAEAMVQTARGLLQLKTAVGEPEAERVVHHLLTLITRAEGGVYWQLKLMVSAVAAMFAARDRLALAAAGDELFTPAVAEAAATVIRYYALAARLGEVELSLAASPGMKAEWTDVLAYLHRHARQVRTALQDDPDYIRTRWSQARAIIAQFS
ncbi:MAG: hypothetical protein HY543_12990 [Deltaproteobacteria bacterium]|nr:hypothetical protein [Deltaproteobacteria bacterium]